MKRSGTAACVTVILMAGLGLAGRGDGPPVSAGRALLPLLRPRASSRAVDYGRLPVQFIPNRGQLSGATAFSVEGRDKRIGFGPDGLTYVFKRPSRDDPAARAIGDWAVKLDFVRAARGAGPAGLEESGTVVSYFRGRPDDWRTGLAAFSKIIYRDLWPGIDLVYQGTYARLKYEFVVRPGADPSRIRLAVRGAETFGPTADGRLEVRTPAGGFEDDAPVAYQEIGGARRPVAVSYDIAGDSFGFSVGGYDGARTLIIDPSTFVYCGVIGGGGDDQGKAIALDDEGCAYIAGRTYSQSSFPAEAGPDLTPNGDWDAFVAKVNAEGTALVYCGFIGGAGTDLGNGIAVDGSGNAYVVGSSTSSQETFPVLVGPDLTYNSGITATYGDGFVAKVGASGTSLEYCGYIGGIDEDSVSAVAADAAGNVYLTGRTDSQEPSFPVAVGPDLTSNLYTEAFVAKVVPSGASLAYCGFIGCNGSERGEGIAVDAAGCAYVTGYTSPDLDGQGQPRLPRFPAAIGPDLSWNGSGDAFVAKVAADGTGLLYCGYIGGSLFEQGHAIAVDGAGCAYVTGRTLSTEATFPVKVGPGLVYHPGEEGAGDRFDAFIAKVDASGTDLVYCGYIGGSWDDYGYGIAVDASGSAYVTGETNSDQSTFPVLNWPYRKSTSMDAFVTKVQPSGAGLDYSGFIGGRSSDAGSGIAVDGSGCAYITGYTRSPDLPTVGGPALVPDGTDDVLVAKVPAVPVVYGPEITALSPASIPVFDPDFTLTVFGTGFLEGAVVNFNYETIPETVSVSGTELRAPVPGNFRRGAAIPVVVYNPGVEVSHEAFFYVNNPVPVLDSVEPAYLSGGYNSSIHVQGTNFVDFSVVRFNGQDVGDNVSSVGSGYAVIPSWLLAQPGDASVTVFNPPPQGGSSNALILPVTGYALDASPDSVTVRAGGRAVYEIQVTPRLGPFDNQIKLSYGDLPRGCTAALDPERITPGAAPGTAKLTVTTKSSSGSAAGVRTATAPLGPSAAGLLVLLFVLRAGASGRGACARPSRRRRILAGATLLLFLTVSGCGPGGDDGGQVDTGTPKGTHTITVRAASGSMTVPLTVTLVVN